MKDLNETTGKVLDCSLKIHQDLGPGLFESVYEIILAEKLKIAGLQVEAQKPISFVYDGISIDSGFRIDMLIDGLVVVELKSIEALAPVHHKQLLTYLKILHLQVGLLINFGAPTLKQGFHRIVNHYKP